MTAVIVIEAVVIVLLLILVAGLLKSHAEILRQLEGLGGRAGPTSGEQLRTTGLGEVPADEITGVDPGGSSVTVSLRHGRGETLLAFMSSGCASCRVFWEELANKPELPTAATRPLVVTKGPTAESPGKIAELAPPGIRVVMSDEAWDVFRVPLTPYFMLIDGDGAIVGEGSATSMSHLVGLFRQSAADSNPRRLNTRERERLTDEQLAGSGVEPGDPSLYDDPLRE